MTKGSDVCVLYCELGFKCARVGAHSGYSKVGASTVVHTALRLRKTLNKKLIRKWDTKRTARTNEWPL